MSQEFIAFFSSDMRSLVRSISDCFIHPWPRCYSVSHMKKKKHWTIGINIQTSRQRWQIGSLMDGNLSNTDDGQVTTNGKRIPSEQWVIWVIQCFLAAGNNISLWGTVGLCHPVKTPHDKAWTVNWEKTKNPEHSSQHLRDPPQYHALERQEWALHVVGIISQRLLTIARTKTLQTAKMVFDSFFPLPHGNGPIPQVNAAPSTRTGLCLQCRDMQH